MRTSKNPWSCYDPRFVALALGVAAVMVSAAWIGRGFPRGTPVRVGLALLQGAASAVVIVAMMRGIRRLDELQQRIHLEALAFSFAGTGIMATGYGFLVNAGFPNIDWGAVVWPVMVGLWAVGIAIANRRYR